VSEIPLLSQVVVKAPATTANLGPGFDVFGMAFGHPNDKVTIIPIPDEGVKIQVSGLAADTIPTDPERNTAGVVARRFLEEFSLKTGLMIRLEKGILPGVGLGSSAASGAAVAFALNHLFSLKLDSKQLIRLAAKGEVASAGVEHADNVSAAILGDFVIVKSYSPLEVLRLEAPRNLHICIAVPQVPIPHKKTEAARSVLPKTVPMDKLVHNVGQAAAMVAGFAIGDVDLIGRSMSDMVVEPARAFLIPGYEKVRKNAMEAGACGVAISGAGPAMMAVVNINKAEASKVAEAMEKGFKSAGVNADAFCTKPGKGVTLLEARE